MKKIYFLIIVIGILATFYIFHTFRKMERYNYISTVLDANLKNSDILEEKLCNITKIRSADKDWFKKYDDNLYFKNILIVCDNEDTYVIKVIVEKDSFDYVYGYEIGGELIYENFE